MIEDDSLESFVVRMIQSIRMTSDRWYGMTTLVRVMVSAVEVVY